MRYGSPHMFREMLRNRAAKTPRRLVGCNRIANLGDGRIVSLGDGRCHQWFFHGSGPLEIEYTQNTILGRHRQSTPFMRAARTWPRRILSFGLASSYQVRRQH